MNPRILLVIEERELRDWLRHHLDILWPDATVEDTPPVQFEGNLRDLALREIDLIVLSANCGDGKARSRQCTGSAASRACRAQLPACGGHRRGRQRTERRGGDASRRRRLPAAHATECAAARECAARGAANSTPRGRRARRARSRWRATASIPPTSTCRNTRCCTSSESRPGPRYTWPTAATLGRNVALKISKPQLESSEDCQEFAREYAAISALRNPAVVEIYDYGFHDGREFIAMEYFPCGDLKMRLQQPMTTTESLQYAQRICAALEVVHAPAWCIAI